MYFEILGKDTPLAPTLVLSAGLGGSGGSSPLDSTGDRGTTLEAASGTPASAKGLAGSSAGAAATGDGKAMPCPFSRA